MTQLSFFVSGIPAPQGSKRHVGGGRMVEMSKKVKPWRQNVTIAATDAAHLTETPQFTGPVRVHVTFFFARPKSHFGTGKNAERVKLTAPMYVASTPDIDKLLRSTFDALTTAGIWRDDSQAVTVSAQKIYGSRPGANISIWRAQETP